MNKWFLFLGVLWLLLGAGAYLYSTLGAFLMSGFMGGIFLVLGLAGDELP